jgi:hypothetical protein
MASRILFYNRDYSVEMKNHIYTTSIEVPFSPHYVFNRVIDLSKWWQEEYIGESIVLNTQFVFKTGEGHYSKNRVVEFKPDKKFVWLTTESIRKSDNFDWTGTRFIFEFTPKAENTLIEFTYDGIILENEVEKLAQICDMTLKEMLVAWLNNRKDIV